MRWPPCLLLVQIVFRTRWMVRAGFSGVTAVPKRRREWHVAAAPLARIRSSSSFVSFFSYRSMRIPHERKRAVFFGEEQTCCTSICDEGSGRNCHVETLVDLRCGVRAYIRSATTLARFYLRVVSSISKSFSPFLSLSRLLFFGSGCAWKRSGRERHRPSARSLSGCACPCRVASVGRLKYSSWPPRGTNERTNGRARATGPCFLRC